MQKLFNHPFLGRGFRPFFLCGALYGALSILLWVLQMQGFVFLAMPFDDIVLWHSHEMVFGFSIAIVAGFLLTAVANWTGGAPARQIHLAALFMLWLAGRVAMNLDIDARLAATIDLLFIPALTVSLMIPLLGSWNKRNFIFLIMLGALFVCNLFTFLLQDRTGVYVAIFIILMMVTLIGGRIIPAFTVAALRRKGLDKKVTPQPKMDVAALLSLVLVGLSVLVFDMMHIITGGLALVSAGIHVWRLRFYHVRDVWQDPLLWSLHLGYIWLIIGLVLMALAAVDVMALSPALHALTAGTIGTLTLSMMCRVALGHTGRELKVGKATAIAFVFMQGAVLTRVVGPVVLPDLYLQMIIISGVLWVAAFGLYMVLYAPCLWQARPDGHAP